MSKTIITRIKNKVDSLQNWQGSTNALLDGEIAIVRVPTGETYTNPVTGKTEPVIELLMKVGDGVHKFDEVDADGNPYLPWLSAKASDVYNWAKMQDPSDITVKYIKDGTTKSSTLADVLKDLEIAESAIEGLKSDVAGVRGLLSVESDPTSKTGVVQGITYNSSTGKFTVSYGLIKTADIDAKQVTAAKIADSTITATQLASSAVTTAKIADGAVTNAKLGSDISTDKINVGTGTTSGKLSAKIASMDAAIAGKSDTGHTHPYLPDTTKYAGSTTQGGAANSVASSITVKLNSGSTEGTDLFTFDGSAAKTVNITPSAIGASASGHTHDGRYYTEDEINAKVTELNTAIDGKAASDHNHDSKYITPAAVDTKISTALGSVLKYKGTKATTSQLPTSGNAVGDVWNITSAGTVNSDDKVLDVNAGDNVAWNGTDWDVLAGTVDLSSYYTETEVNALLAEKSDKVHTHNYAGSASAGGPANSVKANLTFSTSGNGAANGTTYNGSTARTISYNSVGAAPATHSHTKDQITDFDHNHNDSYYIKSEVNALLAEKSGTDHSHTISAGAEDDDVVVLTGTGDTNGVSYKATHAESGVTAGTYKSVTVDEKGHVTAGTNPTTISGFGITDAYTKAEVNSKLAEKAASSHAHGNITSSGTITSAAVTSAIGVLVYDNNNKIQRATAANARSIIGAADSGHNHDTRYVRFDTNAQGLTDTQKGNARTNISAAASNHTHAAHEARTAVIEGNYVRVDKVDNKDTLVWVNTGSVDEIILDCGGAPV